MGHTATIASFVRETTFDNLPEEVVHVAKQLILDTIACAIGGHTTEMGTTVVDYVRDIGNQPESTVIGTKYKVSCQNAAFANAQLANALDFDETFHNAAHPFNPTFMATLALGERVECDGKDLITSVVVGYDVAARVAQGQPGHLLLKGRPPNIKVVQNKSYGLGWNVFGPVTSSSKVIGLSEEKIANAFGIAAQATVIDGEKTFGKTSPVRMSKYAVIGWLCQLGVAATLLAQKGFTSDTNVFDGDRGWSIWLDRLGEKWWITEASLKTYPCCRWNSHPLSVFYRLLEEHKIRPEDIKKVVLGVHPAAVHTVSKNVQPKTEGDIQFSVPILIAFAALRIDPTNWLSADLRTDPRVLELAKKVVVEGEPNITQIMYEQAKLEEGKCIFRRTPASVEVYTERGTFKGYTEYSPGDPWTPETKIKDEQLNKKFRVWASKTLPGDKIEKVMKMIYELEKVDNVRRLTNLLMP